jgi:hypothetical protein
MRYALSERPGPFEDRPSGLSQPIARRDQAEVADRINTMRIRPIWSEIRPYLERGRKGREFRDENAGD